MKTIEQKLQAISEKYTGIESNADNYYVGGGLDSAKFASRRHEDACNDAGKLTLGKTNQLFAKATEMTVSQVEEVILFAHSNLEWHHAGKLPKQYGGGMKKTYFVNSNQIVNLAENWFTYVDKLASKKEADRIALEDKRTRDQIKADFLKENATYLVRINEVPENFYPTKVEMNGKYGWFDSAYKSYNLPEYFTGWQFSNAETMNAFYSL